MASEEDPVPAESDRAARERERVERRAILDQMTAEAEELGLYDDPPPDYQAALRNARRRRARRASESR